jgi:hypothetical protein
MNQERHPPYISEERKKVDDLAKEWRRWAEQQVPEGEQGIFMRFIALWVAFNAVYVSRYDGDSVVTELTKIQQIASKLSDFHRSHLARDHDYSAAVHDMSRRSVYNTMAGIEFRINNPRSIRSVLKHIYYVRNNLFHGRKVPSELHDRVLVSNGVVVLDQLLLHLLRPEGQHAPEGARNILWQP